MLFSKSALQMGTMLFTVSILTPQITVWIDNTVLGSGILYFGLFNYKNVIPQIALERVMNLQDSLQSKTC